MRQLGTRRNICFFFIKFAQIVFSSCMYSYCQCTQNSTNCYDNFELKKCEIVDEQYEGEGDKQIAKVKFVATMTQVDSREKTAFMETSTFERAGKHIREGAWLYKSGEVEPVPVEDDEMEEDD